MKIGVIGTFINDQITLADRSQTQSFGGIFYTVTILANLLSKSDEIYPVCYLGDDIYDSVTEKLSKYKNVKFSSIIRAKQPNTSVRLIYHDREHRDEYLKNLLPKLKMDVLKNHNGMDAWLINFITGFEMSLETFSQFKENMKAPVFMDYHSLALGISNEGKRFPKRSENWDQWLKGVDVLQMNNNEAATLSGRENASEKELINFGKKLMRKGITIFHLTRGSKGSFLFLNKNRKPIHYAISPHEVDQVVDVTGSGDAFLAGFLVHFIKNQDVVTATRFANFVAALSCTKSGTDELELFQPIFSQIT